MGFLVKVILALAVVAAGVWGYMTFIMPPPTPVPETREMQQEPAPQPQVQESKPDDGGISARGTTDAELTSDLEAFDSQVQSAQSASADVDGSFNDQPVQQTE